MDSQLDTVLAGGNMAMEYSQPGTEYFLMNYLDGNETPDWYIQNDKNLAQVLNIAFDGDFSGTNILSFHYDESLLQAGYDESGLTIYHILGNNNIESLPVLGVDVLNNIITVEMSSFSLFLLGIRDPPLDSDDDGEPDSTDNCPYVYSPDQNNSDTDSHGDACDNCWYVNNPEQTDSDENCPSPPYSSAPYCSDACESAPIPTLSEWGLIIFMTTMMGIGVVILYRRKIA